MIVTSVAFIGNLHLDLDAADEEISNPKPLTAINFILSATLTFGTTSCLLVITNTIKIVALGRDILTGVSRRKIAGPGSVLVSS
jgi:hypothetical protein